MDDTTSLCFLPAHRQAEMIRDREISITELVDAHFTRISDRNDALCAYVHLLEDSARARARELEKELEAGEVGPLHGVPVAIKDLEDIAGVPTVAGSRTMVDNVAVEDTITTARLRQAGAVFLGKTNACEFGHKATTDNLVFGPTSSPFGVGANAGGSSGGSAAAVADGMAALGQGGDGGGSIRIPAALCGIYGIKPSWGRVPTKERPLAFLHNPLASLGPLTRTVRDSALMMEAIAGPHSRDPYSLPDDGIEWLAACERSAAGLRIAYSPDLGGFPIEAGVRSVIEEAVSTFVDAGAAVELVDFSFGHTPQELAEVWRRGVGVEYGHLVAGMKDAGQDLLALGDEGLEPAILELFEIGRSMGAIEYRCDDFVKTDVFDAIQDVFEEFDLLVSPTLAVSRVENAEDGLTVGPTSVEGETVDPTIGWTLTYPFNFTGHPAASIPAGFTAAGAPVGLQVVGRRFADGDVLAASAAFEALRPWAHSYQDLASPAGPGSP